MKISALVEKRSPFEFVFDGETIKGEFYKYKTTTPKYAREARAAIPPTAEGADTETRIANLEAQLDSVDRATAQAMADTIVSWDAVGDDGEVVPITVELFESLPRPFTEALGQHFNDLRYPKKNPPTASPNG